MWPSRRGITAQSRRNLGYDDVVPVLLQHDVTEGRRSQLRQRWWLDGAGSVVSPGRRIVLTDGARNTFDSVLDSGPVCIT